MLGSNMLETMIGLAFVFLFLSTLVSAANEIVAAIFGLRAQNLAKGLKNLLDDPQGIGLFKQLLAHPLIKGFSQEKNALTKLPLIKNVTAPEGVPSYIPSRTFAMALLDIIVVQKPAGPVLPLQNLYQAVQQRIPVSLQPAIRALVDESKGDMNRLKSLIENWFNDAMDRASGWYKRQVMFFSFVFALLLAVALNADALGLFQRLYNDSALKQALSQAAITAVNQSNAVATPTPSDESQSVDPDTAAPATQAVSSPDVVVNNFIQVSDSFPALIGNWTEYNVQPRNSLWWVKKILGLFLTALAVSLGAPFWFDLLGKLTPIRATGPKPGAKPTN